jgi:hypothetical protein
MIRHQNIEPGEHEMDTDFTVGELRRHLKMYGDDTKLSFSGGLGFYRIKAWGDDEAIVEFNEPQADLSDRLKKQGVKVAFLDIDGVEWDESGVVSKPINVRVR